MSIMVSHKKYTPGHQYRHIIARHILKYTWPIDIWGNGVENYKREYPNNKNIMGGFKSMEEMCKNYLFIVYVYGILASTLSNMQALIFKINRYDLGS